MAFSSNAMSAAEYSPVSLADDSVENRSLLPAHVWIYVPASSDTASTPGTGKPHAVKWPDKAMNARFSAMSSPHVATNVSPDSARRRKYLRFDPAPTRGVISTDGSPNFCEYNLIMLSASFCRQSIFWRLSFSKGRIQTVFYRLSSANIVIFIGSGPASRGFFVTSRKNPRHHITVWQKTPFLTASTA